MSLFTKCGILLLAAAGGWAVSEHELITRAHQEATSAAMRQFHDSDAAADELRQADAATNAWLAFWPLLIIVLAGLLFWDDAAKWCNRQGPDASNANAGDSPNEGDKS